MTRKLQILRGTTALNNSYTGSVGELTMDTTTNQIRIHDGSTVGGHIIGGAPANMQTTTNLVTSVSSSSTDAQYPSAKLFYDTCGDIESLINAL